MPDCIPVADLHGNSPGCVHKADELDPAAQVALTKRYGGVPVYKNAKSAHIVGVLPTAENGKSVPGYVPNRLIPELPQLVECYNAWAVHVTDNTQPAVTTECRALLRDYGMTNAAIDGTGP
jgi:hypothetical protein